MKKAVILLTLAALVPLAGCIAPTPYYRGGYYDRYDGYYGRNGDGRGDPWYGYNRYYDEPAYGGYGYSD